jgi:CheY-like chemotaxis protein
VRTAASVAEVMSALKADLPDVLISDIGLSGEDAYELIRRVRLLPAAALARALRPNSPRERTPAAGLEAVGTLVRCR